MTADGLSIGMATASGTFRVNNSKVKGSASVLNGMHVGTDDAPSYLVIDGGSQVSLSERSSGQVFKDRMILEHGSMRLDRAGNFAVETNAVRVIASDPSSRMRIRLDDQNKVSVDVLSGEARITNLKGIEVARVFPGEPLSFTAAPPAPQAGAAATTKVSGCVQKVVINGKSYYILTDSTTKVRIELQGSQAEKLAGKYVEIEGSLNTTATPVKDTTQVVEVVKVVSEKKEPGCHASGVWAKKVGPVPVLLAGILIGGGVVGGLAAAGTFSGSSAAGAGASASVP